MTEKHVLFVNQTLGLGGAETFNADLLTWLTNQSVQVTVYSNYLKFLNVLKKRRINVNKVPFVIDLIGDWKGLLKGLLLFPLGIWYYASVVIKHRRTDVILMTGYVEKIIVTPIARLFGIKVVWIEFGPLASVFSKFGGLPGWLYRLVSKMPNSIIMSSMHTYKSNLSIVAAPLAKIQVIPCAVSVTDPKLVANKNLVVCVSRLERGKGQDVLIQAWQKVAKNVPTAKLKIIGEGDQKLGLMQQITESGLQDSIEMAGWVKDSVVELSRAAVVVFPSLWPLEGFGIVAVEALAVGRPVVIFDRGPLPEIVDSGCGLVVPPGDIDKLAGAIIKLLQQPSWASKLGANGKEKYHKQFTWSVLGPKYLNTLCLN